MVVDSTEDKVEVDGEQVLQENWQREEMEEWEQRCTHAGHNKLLSLESRVLNKADVKVRLTCTLTVPLQLGLVRTVFDRPSHQVSREPAHDRPLIQRRWFGKAEGTGATRFQCLRRQNASQLNVEHCSLWNEQVPADSKRGKKRRQSLIYYETWMFQLGLRR